MAAGGMLLAGFLLKVLFSQLSHRTRVLFNHSHRITDFDIYSSLANRLVLTFGRTVAASAKKWSVLFTSCR